MVNSVMHCDEFSLMWFAAVMCVYRGLGLLDGIHRCVGGVCMLL